MLYYCNAILAGLPASTLAPLQQVMHAPLSAARVDLKPYDNVTPALKALHWLPIKQRTEIQVVSPGPSSYQQQGTCLFTEPPDNHCVRVWSGIKPLSHAATMTLSSSQPDSNLTNAPFPSRRTPRLESAVHPHQSHHRHSIFRRQLKTIFRDHTISTH